MTYEIANFLQFANTCLPTLDVELSIVKAPLVKSGLTPFFGKLPD